MHHIHHLTVSRLHSVNHQNNHNNNSPRALQKPSNSTTDDTSNAPVYFAGLGERPPLSEIVNGRNVIGNVSWLLDFAVVGFPKCGTTSIMRHLQSHPGVAIHSDERCDLSYNNQGYLARALYRDFPHDVPLKRGLKCPLELENNLLGMPNYRKYFPNTKFIIGGALFVLTFHICVHFGASAYIFSAVSTVRNPILWFESFYNFRIHNKYPMPPAEKLIGRCIKGMFNVCTFRSRYHLFMANLGKTPLSNQERALFGKHNRIVKPTPTPVPVFLYEVTQLSDTDPTREMQLLQDLQDFLQLEQPLDRMLWFKPGIVHSNEAVAQYLETKKIDICDKRYDGVRKELLQNGREAAKWMRDYFIKSPDVVVSSPDYFVNHVLAAWEVDPCIARRNDTVSITW
eukprot:scaffold2614_cov132-Amphora_coffeaeformis.AAC.1